jgi:hypothetical protein
MLISEDEHKEKIHSWLYKYICEEHVVSSILDFKIKEFKRIDNIIEIYYEFFLLETKDFSKLGLFSLGKFLNYNQYFPYGVFHRKEKQKFIFSNKYECETLGEGVIFELPHFSSETYYDWNDGRIPEGFIANLFDYRSADNIGLKIIKKFNLLDEKSKVPECIPFRLLPHLKKSVSAYRSLLK